MKTNEEATEEASIKKPQNKRRYNYAVVVYEDDPNFSQQYEMLTSLDSAIWIRHACDIWDKDVFEEDGKTIKYNAGDLKKPHYHFLLKFKNATTLTALASRVGCEERQIEYVKKSFNGALKYLIHYGWDEKYQYSVDDVQSNSERLKQRLFNLIANEIPEAEKVMKIQDLIEHYDGYINIGILGRQVSALNLWDAFRRNLTYFTKVINSQNARYMGLKSGQADLEYTVDSCMKGNFD